MTRESWCHWTAAAVLLALLVPGAARAQVVDPDPTASCDGIVVAQVVAFDQVFFWNRLGAVQPQGMMYALRRDVVPVSGTELTPGNVQLRPDKRPRPLVLRVNRGDCLRIEFQNLLAATQQDEEQPATRWASIHIAGLELKTLGSDGSFVGENASSLVDVGDSITYFLQAPDHEGEHVMYSAGATNGGEGDSGSASPGLFGALIVEPVRKAKWYRSQVTRQELDWATTGFTTTGQRILNYEARYPGGHPREGDFILNMRPDEEIIHSDLTAIIMSNSTFVPESPHGPRADQPLRRRAPAWSRWPGRRQR
jgi:hypothetical protein